MTPSLGSREAIRPSTTPNAIDRTTWMAIPSGTDASPLFSASAPRAMVEINFSGAVDGLPIVAANHMVTPMNTAPPTMPPTAPRAA